MALRILGFVGFLLVGAGLGYLLGVSGNERYMDALWAALLGSALWFVLDAVRATRVLGWLTPQRAPELPLKSGVWGEVLERTQRLLRDKDRTIADSNNRLQDFLSARVTRPG